MRYALAFVLLAGCQDVGGCNNSGDAESAVEKKYGFKRGTVTCILDAEGEMYWCEYEPTGAFFRCAGSGTSVKCINSPWTGEDE